MKIGDTVVIHQWPEDHGDNGKLATIISSVPHDREPIWKVELEDGTHTIFDECELRLPMPLMLVGVVPTVGSEWIWQPLNPRAYERVTVTDVVWNGEEVFVTSTNKNGSKHTNDFGHWVQVAVIIPNG